MDKAKRDYVRVPNKLKVTLIQMVFRECYKIKQAAELIGIKYAAAKTIVILHRKKNLRQLKKTIKLGRIRCTYKKIGKLEHKKEITIISNISGERAFNKDD